MREAGFRDATETGRHRSPLASLSFHRGSKKGTDGAVH
jgi:hypothetical protein